MQTLRAISLMLVLALGSALAPVQAYPAARTAEPLDHVIARLMTSLTSEERVGQLMLVTFEGTQLGPDTAITQLIAQYNIGGVVLLAANDNITGQDDTPRLVQSLTADLQRTAYQAAESTGDRAVPRAFVPLFIATTHAGNDLPGTQIVLGTTPLPSEMALGATWNPANAQQVGQIAGSELSAMGINLLLGPALDVMQVPQAGQALNLGVNSFGGDPYWVGKMAQAYITGVHTGSQGRIAVIVQHFPGLGAADTQPETEIPVVPRSVDDLYRFELVPYGAVTGSAGNTPARADGMQCANVRYQGENSRSMTRPVCVDEQAADQLMALDYFRSWRARGILISSSLGSQAIRRYYKSDPFPHRQVAREAFLAGNDLLYLADFGATPGEDPFANVTDTIKFFAERYENDPVFRAQVDQSLTRLLRLKLALYQGDLSWDNVQLAVNDIAQVGTSSTRLYTIADQSVTLIAPRRESLPPAPSRDENIVIFTDVRWNQQCSSCATYPTVSVNALEAAIERMYGPYAGAQVRPDHVISFSFSQLQAYLSGDFDSPSDENQFRVNQRMAEALRTADWVVLVMLDVAPDVESSSIVGSFLERETALVDRAHVVAIALGAPLYLSSTEISKFAAYYGLYSSTPPYIDAAARALFQESSFSGALPISVPAAGYDLAEMTSPTADQTIALEANSLSGKPVASAAKASDTLTMRPGERLVLRTGPILDHNGHPVPDNTPVDFTLNFVDDSLPARQFATTREGVASTSFTPNQAGRVQITATSQNATRSETLQIIIADESAPLAQTGTPTPGMPLPTAESVALGAAEPVSASDPGAAITPAPDVPAELLAVEAESTRQLEVLDFVLSLFGLLLMGGLGFRAGLSVTRTRAGGMRVVLGSVVAGLAGYIYYGLGGPGTRALYAVLEDLAPLLTTLGTGLVGLMVTWWMLRRSHRARAAASE